MASDLQRFMATMVSPARPMPMQAAVALAREHYGLEVSAERMTGERDENFRLRAADGADYVLKIAHAAEAPRLTELFTAALLYLEQTDPALPCPRVRRTRGGDPQLYFIDHSGQHRTARLLTYLPGTLLGSTPRSAPQRRACGRMAGRMSRVLRDFEHPAARRDLIWDLRHTRRVRQLLDELPRFPHRAPAGELLDRLVPMVEQRLPPLRQQVVHNDVNPLNVLVDPADATRIVGLIDFGDLAHTALIADVAVTAAEQIPPDCGDDAEQATAAVRDIVTAYQESTPLLAEELRMLGTLVAARLAANLVVHEWHVDRNPANSHHAPLQPDFIQARLALARELSREEFKL